MNLEMVRDYKAQLLENEAQNGKRTQVTMVKIDQRMKFRTVRE